MVQESTEASVIGPGSVHDTLGTVLALRHPSGMSRPLLSSRDLSEYVDPSLLIGEAKLIWSDADNFAKPGMNLGRFLRQTTTPLPVILHSPF